MENKVPLPREPSPAPLLGRGGAARCFGGTDQSPSASAVFAMHKPLTADSDGFFFSGDCPIYKYKAVSFKNLFYCNHLIHLVCGTVQKPPAASAASFGEDCGRRGLQKASGRLAARDTGCLWHRTQWQGVTSALPGSGEPRLLWADVGPLGMGKARSSSAGTGVAVSAGQHR